MRRLGYIRTSTDKQLINRQIDQLRAVCDEVFIEDGVSAVNKQRPVYEAVMSSLQSGDVFVVVALDRAYRSVIDALVELDKMQQRGVAFCSLSQNFDTRTPEGKLLYTISAALAEWEREIISQRTREGLEAARRRGKTLGRPRKLTAEQVDWARRKLDAGSSRSEFLTVCDDLRVSDRTLARAIRA